MSIAVGPDATALWRPGGTIAGFRLVVRIAGGTATEIWLAKIMGAEGFEKVIVLKTMRSSLAPSPAAAQALTGEAAVTARLYHRNIIQLIDCGHVDDRYYMVMEFIDGMNLRQMLSRLREQGRPIPWKLLAHIAIEVCAALQYLHELHATHGPLGYLHRAIEPENVMITGAGAVKLIDFGAARPAPGGGEGRPLGRKLRYASPEVVQGTTEDRRGDIYSLGAVLYELITGVPAFDGDSLRVVSRIVEGKPRPARTLVPELPEALAAIVDKAMARRREDRFASADAMSVDLQNFIDQVSGATDRGQSIKDVLRSLFDGLSGTFWREALFPSLRSSTGSRAVRSVPAPVPPEPPPVEQLIIYVQDSGDEVIRVPADKTEPDACAPVPSPAPAPASAQVLLGLFAAPVVAPPPPADIFPAAPRSAAAVVGDAEEGGQNPFAMISASAPSPARRSGADAFALRRGGAPVDPVAAWVQGPGAEPAPVSAESAPGPADSTSTEAAWCFDRGLAFISDRNYPQALAEWQRAIELDPGNRLYQTNLKRLRAQIEGQSRERTETP